MAHLSDREHDMGDDYTPSTEAVRQSVTRHLKRAEFDRWLIEHDASVLAEGIRQGREQMREEAADAVDEYLSVADQDEDIQAGARCAVLALPLTSGFDEKQGEDDE